MFGEGGFGARAVGGRGLDVIFSHVLAAAGVAPVGVI